MRMLALLLALAAAGCSSKKKAGSDEPTPCRSDADCPDDLVCYRYECTAPAKAAKARARGLPSTQGVTPESVKREVDGISRDYERKVDKSLDE